MIVITVICWIIAIAMLAMPSYVEPRPSYYKDVYDYRDGNVKTAGLVSKKGVKRYKKERAEEASGRARMFFIFLTISVILTIICCVR
ncbi:MAG: hypothetical protein WDN09_03025 [bacterium]